MSRARALSILLVAGAAGLAGLAVTTCAAERAREQWPVARGIMDSAAVRDGGTSGGRRGGRIYVPDISYTYVVGADTFHGWRLSWEEPNDHSAAALRQRLRAFPVGQPVSVHYDPRHPSRAVLETGGNNSGLLAWCGVFFLLILAAVQDAKARSGE